MPLKSSQASGDDLASRNASNLLKLMEKFDGESDVVEWLTRLELSARLHSVCNLRTILPLLLTGAAFQLYQNMDADSRDDVKKLKAALIKSFGLNEFTAYRLLTMRKCAPGESIDAYYLDLKRLAKSAKVISNPLLKCAVVNGLPHEVASVIRASPAIDAMEVEAVVDLARALTAVRVENNCAVAAQNVRSNVVCHKCGLMGHYATKCPKRSLCVNQRKCFACGDEGHYSNVCPNRTHRTGNVRDGMRKESENF